MTLQGKRCWSQRRDAAAVWGVAPSCWNHSCWISALMVWSSSQKDCRRPLGRTAPPRRTAPPVGWTPRSGLCEVCRCPASCGIASHLWIISSICWWWRCSVPGETSCGPSPVSWWVVGGSDWRTWLKSTFQRKSPYPCSITSQMRLFCMHLFCHSSVYNYGKFRKNRRTRFEKRDEVVGIFFPDTLYLLNPRPAGVWLVTRPAGGGAKGPPPLRSLKLLDGFPNFKRHSIALYVNYPYKVNNLTRRLLMTSQVRSKSEFSTFRAWWLGDTFWSLKIGQKTKFGNHGKVPKWREKRLFLTCFMLYLSHFWRYRLEIWYTCSWDIAL